MNFIEMLKHHKLYIIWCVFYVFISWFMLGANGMSFILTIICYAISISIALSPMGEKILRFIEGARRPATREEKEYLLSLYNEVYEYAKEKNNKLSDNIQLFIIEKMFINACAMGKNTICITKGALHTFTEDELKGVLAHELGHISNGDTIALLLNVVGNGIFTLLMFIQRLIFFTVDLIATMLGGKSMLTFIIHISKSFFDFLVLLILLIGQMILSVNSRQNEYLADKFAYDIGCGDELIKALYILQNTNITNDMKLIDRLRNTHPHLAYRIEKLETMQDEEIEEQEA